MSLELDEETLASLGLGDIFGETILQRKRPLRTGRRKGAQKARAPFLRCASQDVFIALVRAERDRRFAERKKNDLARRSAWQKNKYKTDPKWRQKKIDESRAYTKRKDVLKARRDRYFFDVEFRKNKIAKVRKYQAKRKAA